MGNAKVRVWGVWGQNKSDSIFNDTFVFSTSSNSLRSSFPTEKIQRLFSKINNVKVALMVKNSPASTEDVRFDPWVRKIPWRRARQPTPVFLPGESPWTEEPAGYSPWSHKESDITEWVSTCHSTEENMSDLHRHQSFQTAYSGLLFQSIWRITSTLKGRIPIWYCPRMDRIKKSTLNGIK